jgi:hypothetical protein
MAEETGLLDTGAIESFIDHKTVIRLHLGTQKLMVLRPVYNVDGSANQHGTITHVTYLLVTQGHKKQRVPFYVTNLGQDQFIFGYPWCQDFKPNIDWENSMLNGPKIKVETLLYGKMQHVKCVIQQNQEKEEDFVVSQGVCPPWSGVTSEEIQSGRVEINRTNTVIEMAHKYAQENEKEEVKLPDEFKKHVALFSDEEASKFPPSYEWDHKIELTENAPASFNCKVYPMSKKEQEAEDKFLDENLAKGYIVPSDSPYGFSTFMVPKKDSNEMRYIIDYRPLNAITRKDVTPLPNLAQCIEDLQGMELFSKFNVRWGYNNIQIRETDQWKSAFKTHRGLYKAKVMFFSICNSLAAFQ